jgi:RNA polymerase-binding transcription factor DksA
MADDVDITQDRLEKETAALLEAHNSRSKRHQVMDSDGVVICADCGGVVSIGRILAGYANCIDCQTAAEKVYKLNRRTYQ